jgi:hypothetical protein
VECRGEGAVGPAGHQVADIDHKGTGDRRGVDPFASPVANLQRRHRVLRQNGETFVVGVSADAHMGEVQRAALARVIHHPGQRHRLVRHWREIVLGQVEPERECGEQPAGKQTHRDGVFGHHLAEAGQIRRPLVAGLAEVALHKAERRLDIFGDEVEALMDVALADRGIGIFLAHADIADEVGRLLDMDGLLVGRRYSEKALGLSEHPVHQRLRDAVVPDVKEPDIGTGIPEVCRDVRLGCGIARQHACEIDDWDAIEIGSNETTHPGLLMTIDASIL